MELQVPHSICAEISAAGDLPKDKGRHRNDTAKIVRQQRSNNACPDHVHMLVSIPPHISVAQFMGYLKGKSSLMIFDRHANLKHRYGNRHFWCRGYYVDTVGRNEKAIKEYVNNQLQEDIMNDQLSFKEYIDPFTGSKNSEA